MLKPIFLVFSFLLAAGTMPAAHACKCPRFTVPEKISEADIVFLGVPAKWERAHSMAFGPFKIEKIWKGKVGTEDRFWLRSAGECGITVRPGATYLIYAKRSSKGMLRINPCASLNAKDAQPEISCLDKMAAGGDCGMSP